MRPASQSSVARTPERSARARRLDLPLARKGRPPARMKSCRQIKHPLTRRVSAPWAFALLSALGVRHEGQGRRPHTSWAHTSSTAQPPSCRPKFPGPQTAPAPLPKPPRLPASRQQKGDSRGTSLRAQGARRSKEVDSTQACVVPAPTPRNFGRTGAQSQAGVGRRRASRSLGVCVAIHGDQAPHEGQVRHGNLQVLPLPVHSWHGGACVPGECK